MKNAVLNALRLTQPASVAGQWVHCSPSLIGAGVSCADTPRRACQCHPDGVGHDHFIAHASITHSKGDDGHAFKNFHRLLCERFNYVHDEKDWRRDQLSLIEHIAGIAGPESVVGQQGNRPWKELDDIDLVSDERFSASVIEWRDRDDKRGFQIFEDPRERNALAAQMVGVGFEVIAYDVLYEVSGSLADVGVHVGEVSRFD
ncbi:hypothetical protein [Paraburkholderia domus]|uniref:hypothetical protein n=1 Tax=Paraburkholderia domus TaxID=2793075 RepID=UPI0019136D26|nr:hypothetical protein [Paraburkholderia domus]MBK5064864.1 hypothetical protein [Burkholderia sp. R-70199]CAE6967732.1 hypothetical protein R70199_07878 [Paraburkholderia domus]